MSNSSLVSYTRLSPNCTKPRNHKIDKITIHHMSVVNGTIEGVGNGFANPARQASSNYGIDSNGRIALYVDEANRSWCSSNAANDHRAVTIEVANCKGAPNWEISDKPMAALINLCTDICKRNGIAKLNYTGNTSGNLTMHCWFAATDCPGPYLKSKFPYIAQEVNKRLATANTKEEVKISMGEITGINTGRGTNHLVLITDGRKTTGFNKWGCDVIINSKGVITQVVVEKANTPIPAGCICLSGHGTNEHYLIEHSKVGKKLKIG